MKLAKACTKEVRHKKPAQDEKLHEKHVNRKRRKVLESNEGVVAIRTKACQP